MDVDKLFKLPKLSSSSLNKRKWAEPSADALKAARTDHDSDTASLNQDRDREPSPSSIPSKKARVSDEGDEQDKYDASFDPAEEDDSAFMDEDEDGGRFFGGGLTDQQKKILEIMNRGEPDDDQQRTDRPEVELANIRKQLLRFEKAINKNQEMRVKYADDPTRFIDSEADLDVEIKSLVILTTNPALYYPEFSKLGTVTSLCGLLSHENVDIAAAAIELIEELTDDDVLDAGEALDDNEDEEEEEDMIDSKERKGKEGMTTLVDALLENSVVELLISNLSRFKDQVSGTTDQVSAQVEGDAQAIYHTLGVLENLVSFRPSLSEVVVCHTFFLKWVLTRVSRNDSFDLNKGYAGEMLAIVMQNNDKNQEKLGEMDGIDTLLTVLSPYRKRDPSDADETEFMENIFDALCSCLSLSSNKKRFLDGEGVELMVIMMKEKRLSKLRSIKVLDHAMSGPAGVDNCNRFIECLGLKTLFSAFMSKSSKKSKTTTTTSDLEHILGILVSLFTHLPSESVQRLRLLTKFVEEDYAKVDRLLEIREVFTSHLQTLPSQDNDHEEIWYLQRLELGLFSLQLVDFIIAWLCMEDDGIQAHIKMLLHRKNLGFQNIISTLLEYNENIGDQVAVFATVEGEQEIKTQEILTALMDYLNACIISSSK